MNIENELNKLKNVRRQEAPYWLGTRIMTRIAAVAEVTVSRQWKWAFTAAASVVVLLNIVVLVNKTANKKEPALNEMIQTMQLSTSNDLYHE